MSINAPKPQASLPDRLWDMGMKALVPVCLLIAGTIVAQATQLSDHEGRLVNLEKLAERTALAHERMADALTKMEVMMGRLEERLLSLASRK